MKTKRVELSGGEQREHVLIITALTYVCSCIEEAQDRCERVDTSRFFLADSFLIIHVLEEFVVDLWVRFK